MPHLNNFGLEFENNIVKIDSAPLILSNDKITWNKENA